MGSDIQQSRMLIPQPSQQSMTAFTSSALCRSSHSAPSPISLTFRPVFPNSLYLMIFPVLLFRRQAVSFNSSRPPGPAVRDCAFAGPAAVVDTILSYRRCKIYSFSRPTCGFANGAEQTVTDLSGKSRHRKEAVLRLEHSMHFSYTFLPIQHFTSAKNCATMPLVRNENRKDSPAVMF